MGHNHFADRLFDAVREKQSVVCVGLDPRWSELPEYLRQRAVSEHGRTRRAAAEAFYLFNYDIIKAVAPYCVAVKPQVAFYEQFGPEGLKAYIDTISFARQQGLLVIGDIKRGDIGSTSEAYAAAIAGRIVAAVERLGSHPRLGRVVPEYGDEAIREIVVGNYRIVYRTTGQIVAVVAVIHAKRDFAGRLGREPWDFE